MSIDYLYFSDKEIRDKINSSKFFVDLEINDHVIKVGKFDLDAMGSNGAELFNFGNCVLSIVYNESCTISYEFQTKDQYGTYHQYKGWFDKEYRMFGLNPKEHYLDVIINIMTDSGNDVWFFDLGHSRRTKLGIILTHLYKLASEIPFEKKRYTLPMTNKSIEFINNRIHVFDENNNCLFNDYRFQRLHRTLLLSPTN